MKKQAYICGCILRDNGTDIIFDTGYVGGYGV
jgi:hypothetical protein